MDKTIRVNSAAARDQAYLLHPATNLQEHRDHGPLVITRGEGVHVFDENGKDYIEGLAGLWCVSLGFSEPRLAAAAERAMRTLPYYHAYANRSHPVAGELAEALIGIAPDGMSKVFFANSGSEALDTAVKIVWFYNNVLGRPEKKKIIARERAYHGANIASGSLTGLAAFHHGFDLPREFVVRTACPHHYRFAEAGEDEAAFATRLAAELEALILREGPDTIGAFVAEPVMGGGGVLIPPEGYFPKVQAVLAKYDILSIADEVICGFGRTGNMWGCQTYDFVPDIVTSAKALSSAYLPISAVMISEPIYAALLEESGRSVMFGHGYTYSAHPVTAAVALETLRIYEERDIVGMVRIAAPHFQARLRALGDHPLVGQTRGVGLLGALELMRDGAARIPFDAADGVPGKVLRRAEEHGLLIRAMGDSVALSPPLIITEDEVDAIFDRLVHALDDVWFNDVAK